MNLFYYRLSKVVGVKLIYGNVVIIDLSDIDCFMKLVEKFLEFYDNVWMDVFEEFDNIFYNEEEMIKVLFWIF